MIRHVVVFRFRDGVGEIERLRLLREQNKFPSIFPAMRNWALGRNISQRDQAFTYAFSVEFATEADLVDYLNSERHERFVRERFRPLIESRVIVSFEVADDGTTEWELSEPENR